MPHLVYTWLLRSLLSVVAHVYKHVAPTELLQRELFTINMKLRTSSETFMCWKGFLKNQMKNMLKASFITILKAP
jgi:hypothetical protein